MAKLDAEKMRQQRDNARDELRQTRVQLQATRERLDQAHSLLRKTANERIQELETVLLLFDEFVHIDDVPSFVWDRLKALALPHPNRA